MIDKIPLKPPIFLSDEGTLAILSGYNSTYNVYDNINIFIKDNVSAVDA
jgi:hypothetical protein